MNMQNISIILLIVNAFILHPLSRNTIGNILLFFQPEVLKKIVQKYETPVWAYNVDSIRNQINRLRKFDVIRYAQKACSNTHILQIMRDEGVFVDAVSYGEIERSLAAGYCPRKNQDCVVFTSDVIDQQTIDAVIENDIAVNAGSLDMLKLIGEASPRHRVWLRINPGFGHGYNQKINTGGVHSKHGIWFSELPSAIKLIKLFDLDLIGLHIHIGSGSDLTHLSQVCDSMVKAVMSLNYDIKAISAGGGLPVSYREDEAEIDVCHYFELWNIARHKIENHLGHSVQLEIEPGRFLVANSGILIAKVHSIKSTPEHNFVLVDAGFNDLVRPSMYGSYHKIDVIEYEKNIEKDRPLTRVVIAGPLCESGDVFTQDSSGTITNRLITQPKCGELLVFHGAGAYGASMSSNYNSRPLAPEVLIDKGCIKLIRRRQTISDLLSLEAV